MTRSNPLKKLSHKIMNMHVLPALLLLPVQAKDGVTEES